MKSNKQTCLAIIPARSGSRGVIDKNIQLLNGKPLLSYTIEAAVASGVFDTVMVSTDSEEYANVSARYGAEVPFLRSEATSSDDASTWDTVDEVLRMYDEREKSFDSFCVLQPTSPLRNAKHIVEAYRIFVEKASVAVVSVCETEHSPAWCNFLKDDMNLDGFVSRNNMGNRQSIGKYYRLNGAIYFLYINEYKKDRYMYRSGSYAYVMEQMCSVDIDTKLDFAIAETLLNFCEKIEG